MKNINFKTNLFRPKFVEIANHSGCDLRGDGLNDCITYNIRTTLYLFRTYLEACETLELVVLEKEDYVIGSAFINNLVDVLNGKKDLLKFPLVDCAGEAIGEILIHLYIFIEANYKNETNKQYSIQESVVTSKKYQNNKDKKENFKPSVNQRGKVQIGHSQTCSKSEKQTLNVIKKSSHFCEKLQSTKSMQEKCKLNRHLKSLNSKVKSPISKGNANKNEMKQQFEAQILPQINTVSDTSKVISINLFPTERKSVSEKQATRKSNANISYNKPTLPFKPVQRSSSFNSECVKQSNSKTIVPTKCLTSSETKMSSSKRVDQNQIKNESKTANLIKEQEPCSEFSVVQKNRNSDGFLNKRVMDYLLGHDMSKKDEELALNVLKEMSPSQNFVSRITQLAIPMSDSPTISNYKISVNDNRKVSLNSNKNKFELSFNFNDPLERKYYNKFFADNQSLNAFSSAKLIDESCHICASPVVNCIQNSCLHRNTVMYEEDANPSCSAVVNKKQADLFLKSDTCESSLSNKDTCCLYNQKISELDKIIETLNHFDKRTLSQGKKSENTNIVELNS